MEFLSTAVFPRITFLAPVVHTWPICSFLRREAIKKRKVLGTPTVPFYCCSWPELTSSVTWWDREVKWFVGTLKSLLFSVTSSFFLSAPVPSSSGMHYAGQRRQCWRLGFSVETFTSLFLEWETQISTLAPNNTGHLSLWQSWMSKCLRRI